MTKEDLFQSFLEDPLIVDKHYVTKEKLQTIKLIDNTGIKLLEVIKLAINGNIDGESDGVIARKINQYLNR